MLAPVTTYLNVPFKQKAEAKAKGARWDSEIRRWFVPMGRDLEPFSSWLSVDPSKLVSTDLTIEAKGVSLSTLLAVLDEVAHQRAYQRFDTPSKVIAGIQAMIVRRARESQATFVEVAGLAVGQLRIAQAAVDQANASVERHVLKTVALARPSSRRTLG